ncbi:MAG: DUF188 domain-containing protein [Clostridia bacterium]|nr:DUF188 domain-containing protein [Clostridia bacterium]
MTLWIDADGCPVVKLAIGIGKAYQLPVVVVKNHAVYIDDAYAKVVTVDVSRDSADFYIVNHMASGDIVVTQDYGLAAMVLSRSGKCISQSGRLMTRDNIELLLDQRHTSRVDRQKNRKYTKFKKRTEEENLAFESMLKRLIESDL